MPLSHHAIVETNSSEESCQAQCRFSEWRPAREVVSHFRGEDPRGRARSLSPPHVRSPSSCAAGEGLGDISEGPGGERVRVGS